MIAAIYIMWVYGYVMHHYMELSLSFHCICIQYIATNGQDMSIIICHDLYITLVKLS